MSTRAPQKLAIVMVFSLLAGMTLLTMAPYEVGTIRLAGVSLLWWYGLVVTPAAAVLVTVVALLRAVHAPAPPPPASPPAPE
ncbi:MAG: hypothetical protein FJ027_14385 [Candidatus Rokubacteria bacterium]|nr:hypothetical protein [Candidatus Rokubacteria bacterium]